jgi:hypothetical protein
VLFHRQFENTLTEVFVLNDSSTHCVTAVALFLMNFSFARFKVLKLKSRLFADLSIAHFWSSWLAVGLSVDSASNNVDF